MRNDDIRELADEYVVGLLTVDEAEAVERRMAEDPVLAAAVAAAAERFIEIDLTEPPAETDAGLWERIDRKIEAQSGPELPRQAANTNVPGFWKPLAQAGIAATLLLSLGVGWSVMRPMTEPELIAVLLDAAGEPQAVVEAFADDSVLVLPLELFDVPDGRTLQVWTLPDVPDAKPVSLGLLVDNRGRDLRGPDLPQPVPGQLYEITIEPAGGSPTGLPTGPIVGKGFAKTPI